MASSVSKSSSLKGVKLLHKEIKTLIEKPIDGIEVCPNESDLFVLIIIIVGPSMILTFAQFLRWIAL